MTDLEALKPYATAIESWYIDAIIAHGSINKASKAINKSRRTVGMAIARVKKRAAKRGFAPEHDMTHTAPDGYVVKGVSTYYDQDGQPRGQWVKTDLDWQRSEEIIREAIEALKEDITPASIVPLIEEKRSEDLLNFFVITDYHFGALSWEPETGADWDIRIAERTLIDAFAHLIDRAPKAETGFLAQLGDFLHSDGILPVTPTSGNILDQDGRFSLIVRSAIRVFRQVVDMMLAKHGRVVLLMAEGNHDIASSIWLRELFASLYDQEPRIEVITSPLPYYAYQHGNVLLGIHHGHKAKPDTLPGIFMSEFREMYGKTTQTYIHCGHMHHKYVKEHNSAIVEQHQTLAARDAHAARLGYNSERRAECITYCKKHLEVGRISFRPEMTVL